MQDLLSLLFYIRKSKDETSGNATVYLRITYKGQRAETSTLRKVSMIKWNAKANKVIGSSIEARQINRHFDIIKNNVHESYQRLLEKKEGISALKIRDEYLGKGNPDRCIIQLFEEHNARMKKLVGKEFSFRTLQRYSTTQKHLLAFISKYYKEKDYAVKDIDTRFINSFIYFLKTEYNISHNSSLKYLAYLKKIVRIAFANGWMDKDPFYNFKLKAQSMEREFLTKEEIGKIMDQEFTISRLEHVRDIFVFSCFTGLSYSDVEKLSEDDVVKGIDGNFWIKIKRTKTKSLSSIPILPIAQNLIEKYQDKNLSKGKLLPVYTNQ